MRRYFFLAVSFIFCCGNLFAAKYKISANSLNLLEARTPAEHSQGLMGVHELNQRDGMIFIFPQPRAVSFWMKNTPMPLDMIFVNSARKVSQIHRKTTPYTLNHIHSLGKVGWVIEMKAGSADAFGIKEGQVLEILP
jgi:uncharacterized membrane protein (UPF0127 family)